ncbi:formylmethanofuran dehydrogenase subunit A [Methanomicrobium antiquum]|uniref:Formylmethanofuran dehydrogenase subunit A n=1 Tax=Methanomicrobium antiquum TaxID=487686 RepID=A0AAF0FM55_9EURY|nr:formylmethanofuran dehydrogenase subunit A [Methanomicrobium antiquum]WFN37038.1 formylmethanofuran dehydrogenase subunit A [Methanomicrobium antiquum]
MSELLVKNAYVIDPINDIKGEIMDIAIRDKMIVESVGSSAEVVDAKGCLTLPGGVDSHTHICGTKVNFGRYMSPEDMRAGRGRAQPYMYPVSGYSVPTVYANTYRYSALGYTTVLEGAMAPLEARHTHEEFFFTSLQDTMANTLFDGNWSVMEAVADKDLKRVAAVVGWTLAAVKGFGVKVTNPGGTEMWGWGKDVGCIHQKIDHFGITPAEIIDYLIQANELLNLPHSVHLHCNNLGKPGNYKCTLETMQRTPDLNDKRQTLYMTHVQFHSYGGTKWSDFCSKSDDVAWMLNRKPQIAIDMGQVMFGKTTTMTADGPMEFNLFRLYNNKWSNHDVELETGSGIIPVLYSRKNLVNSIMWSIGLELALMAKNPWQCMLATDNPNGAPFVKYPEIIALLMSSRYRNEEFSKVHPNTENRVHLPSLDREMDFYEIAVMTRAAQAKALGITGIGKGHLGEGAYGDIAIYPIKTDDIDPAAEYEKIIKGFSSTDYTIKSGRVISRDGNCLLNGNNRTIWVKPKIPDEYDMSKDPEFIKKFERYYSVSMENYPVEEAYLNQRNICIETETKL